jgi:hypothetical protein
MAETCEYLHVEQRKVNKSVATFVQSRICRVSSG